LRAYPMRVSPTSTQPSTQLVRRSTTARGPGSLRQNAPTSWKHCWQN
jgi:hypothetical protein